jgi:hypothetical protein
MTAEQALCELLERSGVTDASEVASKIADKLDAFCDRQAEQVMNEFLKSLPRAT